MAVHMRFKFWYISFPSVLRRLRNVDDAAKLPYFNLELNPVVACLA